MHVELPLTKDTLSVSSESNIKNSSVVYVYGDEREYIESFEHKYDFKIGNILTLDDRVAYDNLDAHLHVPWEIKNLRANFFHRSDLSSCHMQLDHQALVYCLF